MDIGKMLEPLKVHIDGGPAASGAPLFNSKGGVLSINTARERNYAEIRLPAPIGTIVPEMIGKFKDKK